MYKSQAIGLMRWAAGVTVEQLHEKLGPSFGPSGNQVGNRSEAAVVGPSETTTGEASWQTAASLSGHKRALENSSSLRLGSSSSAVSAFGGGNAGQDAQSDTGQVPSSQPPPILSFDEFREQDKLQRKKANTRTK